MTYTFHPPTGLHTVVTRHGRFTAATRDEAHRLAWLADRRDLQRSEIRTRWVHRRRK